MAKGEWCGWTRARDEALQRRDVSVCLANACSWKEGTCVAMRSGRKGRVQVREQKAKLGEDLNRDRSDVDVERNAIASTMQLTNASSKGFEHDCIVQ